MATPDELRSEITKGRETFRAALQGVTANWERQPASGEGEDAWSARQVAEHAIGAEVFFAKAVCDACGYPGPELAPLSLETPADAVTAFDAAVETSNSKIKYVTPEDLAHTHERFGTVEALLELNATHLRDHAQQIADTVS